MELTHHGVTDNYESISGNVNQPWYVRKKKYIFMFITLVLFIVVVTLVVVARSAKPAEEEEVFIPIQWDGDCPKKIGKCPSSFQNRPLLIISFDGFRPEYLKTGFTPTMDKLTECGATAEFMYPVFPTRSFPNHMSQVTGLYPSAHGFIDHNMNDSGKVFKVSTGDSHDPFFWNTDPIWVTAEKQGKKTAGLNWPGTDVEINGTYPTYFRRYNSSLPFNDRMDLILDWLDLPLEMRPSFLALYNHQPNMISHYYGTEGKQTQDMLLILDKAVERLFIGLQQRNLIGCVNVLLLSDHGMAERSCDRVINIGDYTDLSGVGAYLGPFGRLRPVDAENKTALDVLISQFRCKNSHMRVYRKEELPVRMHYSDHRRIEPIILELDVGWELFDYDIQPGAELCSGTDHGYDNLYPEMRGFFSAIGPAFKKRISVEPFISTELYEIMCEILGIIPNPNNGTRGSLHHLLKRPLLLTPQVEPAPPQTAQVPRNITEYTERMEAAECICNLSWREQLSDVNVAVKKQFHLPFGVPYSPQDNATLRLLYNNDYVLAFDTNHLMPMWTSFTLIPQVDTTRPPESICWSGDARISENETLKCSDYNASELINEDVIPKPLYPPDLSGTSVKKEAEYITNSILKSSDYIHYFEDNMVKLFKKWVVKHGHLNIVMGPAFDLLATGIRPSEEDFEKEHARQGKVIVPTHIFIIATWCVAQVREIKDCHFNRLETRSFLLPNKPFPRNCEQPINKIKRNVARIVDIENLTGLSFFTGLPIYDAIRLRTMMPQQNI